VDARLRGHERRCAALFCFGYWFTQRELVWRGQEILDDLKASNVAFAVFCFSFSYQLLLTP
jgi:hypothetical protein